MLNIVSVIGLVFQSLAVSLYEYDSIPKIFVYFSYAYFIENWKENQVTLDSCG
jgi:hypothetical protein